MNYFTYFLTKESIITWKWSLTQVIRLYTSPNITREIGLQVNLGMYKEMMGVWIAPDGNNNTIIKEQTLAEVEYGAKARADSSSR